MEALVSGLRQQSQSPASVAVAGQGDVLSPALSTAEGLSKGRVAVPGACGELVQGTLDGEQPFLISCPIDRLWRNSAASRWPRWS